MTKYRFLLPLSTGICGLIALMSSSSCVVAQTTTPPAQRLDLSRAISIYRSALTEVSRVYVDTLDIKGLSTYGLNSLLSRIDPYTEYISDVERDDFSFMTTGEYGGIGAYIQQSDSVVYVQSSMAGSPAERAGLRMGDAFVEIDGVSVQPGTAAMVSNKLKGPIGTDVSVKIKRLGQDTPIAITLTRATVVVDQVAYRTMYPGGIGYIRLSSFTDKSAADVRRAYEELKGRGGLKSLILDLRNNGGGVLDGAVDILGMFVPKGTTVLTTKGRLPETSRTYTTSTDPIAPDMPIAVLINGGSASASEIVAGTMQDLDRAVLVGSRSYGKGLVQQTMPLPFAGILKVTIARYYIPSGRCIQQLDYSHRNPDGTVAAVPDSLTHTFHTLSGRPVKDGGGIRPDFEVKDELLSVPVYSMIREGYLFRYANQLYLQRRTAPKSVEELQVSDAELDGLITYLEEQQLEYGEMSLRALNQVSKVAEFEGYQMDDPRVTEALEVLKDALKPSIARDLQPHREQVRELLRGVLAIHYFGAEGQYAIGAQTDTSVLKAREILSDRALYSQTLHPTDTK